MIACCPRALAAGVAPGVSAAAARARLPRLALYPRREDDEREARASAAAWALQFTPTASLIPEGVLLEVQGSLRLFGPPARLAGRLRAGLAAMGLAARIATAPTPLAAEWLARAGVERAVLDRQRLAQAIGRLPLGLLGVPEETLRALRALGARTLGDCLALPRAGLARRFGQELLDELDRALGRLPDPRPPFAPPETPCACLSLPSPVSEAEALLFAARRLLAGLCGQLAARGEGATRVQALLHRERGGPIALSMRLAAPARDPAFLCSLLRERLGQTRLAGPVVGLCVSAPERLPLAARPGALFGDPARAPEELAKVLARVRARLGEGAVAYLSCAPDHRPERAHREAEASAGQEERLPLGLRPLWLLERPEPLECEGGRPAAGGELALLAGPERIEAGWWDGRPAARDYFVARNPRGETWWVYRERRAPFGWFLHGFFA